MSWSPANKLNFLFFFHCTARYPFDWKTPRGFLMAWLSQCAGAFSLVIAYTQSTNFVFGSCWLFICIIEDIAQDVFAFNSFATTTSHKNRVELTKSFSGIVQINSDVKQKGRFSDNYEIWGYNER